MTITDKTRKTLWGNSGKLCAICRKELIIDATENDDSSVVGDECHIISGKVNGPRYNAAYPAEKIDSYENLILLCKVHHKMVDDQHETYSRELLSQIKHNHEKWVSEKLRDDKKEIKPLRIIRDVLNIPEYLTRISNGTEFMNIINDAYGFYFSYDELDNEQEVDLVSNFIQTIQDYTDINSFFEAGDKVKATYALNEILTEMDDAGFFIFAEKENQILEGGIGSSTNFPVFHVLITKKTNENIVIIDQQSMLGIKDRGRGC